MARLIVSALAISSTTDTPESVQITMSVSDGDTGEAIIDLPSSDVEVWDTSEKAHIQHYHSYKSGLYTLFAAWPERAVAGSVRVYGLLIKVRRSRTGESDVIWDYGQAIVPLQIMPEM